MIVKLGMEQYALKFYKVYINDDPELTLTHFKTISNFSETLFCTYSRPSYQVSIYRTNGPLVFSSVWVADWPPFEKELPTRLTICSICTLTIIFVILVISRFGFEGGIWVLIAPVPGHCLLVTFCYI